jgi:hypothetical protein
MSVQSLPVNSNSIWKVLERLSSTIFFTIHTQPSHIVKEKMCSYGHIRNCTVGSLTIMTKEPGSNDIVRIGVE